MDTVKVRLQVNPERFNGLFRCIKETWVKEGIKGYYKGATPPLVGWTMMDAVMLGSLTQYRRLLRKTTPNGVLHLREHALAGLGAGFTVSLVAAPVELLKARLQVQYSAAQRLYTGPLDCIRKTVGQHGVTGLWHALPATLIQRSFFSVYWGTYYLTTVALRKLSNNKLSDSSLSFWGGGVASQAYWICSFPLDVVKQRIMTDVNYNFKSWFQAFRDVYRKLGLRGYYNGFVPCLLRAFPTNASAVLVFDTTMRVFGKIAARKAEEQQ
ncbi:ornithine carrier protein [Schizosaccharomyces japonicus yFS275]|uniref:Ornithine carrier protein n=1 Tax=Schizosaccharomyces japonicus (strain yFS275 / FY16936) TaxID=402676 RepID=B6K278_SCHJY|nr:ornithine carrier protein [Schizosaccharomyces japonicus yFS275]EEB07259.2 ornithine carrier protein [Schizosaccharomyces japonicus yFS275]